jgi:phage/plasmid-like protein (TIGR03299 family)
MAHEIEQFGDGTAAFFSARQDAWHQLGTVTTGCLTAEEVMTVAHLGDWDVRKEAMRAVDSGALVPGRWAVTRRHPRHGAREVLGMVGGTYKPIQNETLCDALKLVADETGAVFETAGSLRGGREVFVTMRLPDGLRVAGVDDIDLYLAMCSSHDGSRSGRVLVTPIRIVCANTQAAAFGDNHGEYRFRHTGDVDLKIADVREALHLVPVYLDQFQEAAEKMIAQQLEWEQLQRVAAEVWPLQDADTETTFLQHTRRELGLKALFEDAPTQEGIRHTAWGGYQAITEWLDHGQPAKSAATRAHKILTDGTVTAAKRQAFDLLLAA